MGWQTFNDWLGTLLTLIALLAGWLGVWTSTRKTELRREEVVLWAMETISCLQAIALLSHPKRLSMQQEKRAEQLTKLAIEVSVQLEKGRIFFRNQVVADTRSDKEPAYRGYRPLILDELFVAYEIACAWPALSAADQECAGSIAETCERRFLSLVQQEIGRDRTASVYTRTGGDGAHFHSLLAQSKSGHAPQRQSIEAKPTNWILGFLRRR